MVRSMVRSISKICSVLVIIANKEKKEKNKSRKKGQKQDYNYSVGGQGPPQREGGFE